MSMGLALKPAGRVKDSLEFDASELHLVGDVANPGVKKYYGTDDIGNRGWWDLPPAVGQSGAIQISDGVGGFTGLNAAKLDATTGALTISNDFGSGYRAVGTFTNTHAGALGHIRIGTTGLDLGWDIVNSCGFLRTGGATHNVFFKSGSIGVGAIPLAPIYVQVNAEQLRLAASVTAYCSHTVASTGAITYNVAGADATLLRYNFNTNGGANSALTRLTFVMFDLGTGLTRILLDRSNGIIRLNTTNGNRRAGFDLDSDNGRMALVDASNVEKVFLTSAGGSRIDGNLGLGCTPAVSLQSDDVIALSNDAEGSTARLNIRSIRALVTLTGPQTDTTINLPSGAILLGVSFCVNTAVVDDGGDDTWSAAYTGGATTTLATGAARAINTKVNTLIAPVVATAQTNVRFTPHGGNFTAGVIEIVAYYIDLTSLANA